MSIAATKSKIEKLLAKAERTDNLAEAEAFSAAAERLMLKWGIEAAELEAAGEVRPEEIVREFREFKTGDGIAWLSFAASLAAGFGDIRVLSQQFPGSTPSGWPVRRLHVIGHEGDVALFLTLLDSLMLQALTARKVWRKTGEEYQWLASNWERTKASRQFLVSFAEAVSRRLKAARAEVRDETTISAGAEIVLASKQDRVDDWVSQQHRRLGKARGMAGSWAGAGAGAAAGERADIGQSRVGGARPAIG